jgi:hypothetical protein
MSRGYSGRIVLEIDPSIKDSLYIALARNKLTLKDWFISQCISFIEETNQPYLFTEAKTKFAATPKPLYGNSDK